MSEAEDKMIAELQASSWDRFCSARTEGLSEQEAIYEVVETLIRTQNEAWSKHIFVGQKTN